MCLHFSCWPTYVLELTCRLVDLLCFRDIVASMLLCTAGCFRAASISPLNCLASAAVDAFEPYLIQGTASDADDSGYPVPTGLKAIGVHESRSVDGVPAGELTSGEVSAYLRPGLNAAYPGLRVLHLDPLVCIVDDFLKSSECDEYCALAANERSLKLQQSTTFSGKSEVRTSTTCFVCYQDCPYLLAKASALLGEPVHLFEEPQLVQYEPGQQFRWHYDAIHPSLLEPTRGQRLGTLLVYCDDVPDGGSTAFRDLLRGVGDGMTSRARLEVQPKRGRALLFFPSDGTGSPDFRTLHAGLPPLGSCTKRLAQLWLHAGPRYDAQVPPATSQAEGAELARRFLQEMGPDLL